jgi:hypothetical protein
VQPGEGNAGEPTGNAPLHAAEGQHPDQPDQAPPQAEVRLAAATVHADPLAVHGLELRLDGEDEHLDIGQGVPAVTAAGVGHATSRRRRQISLAQDAGARHRPNMVRLGRHTALCADTELSNPPISRTDS